MNKTLNTVNQPPSSTAVDPIDLADPTLGATAGGTPRRLLQNPDPSVDKVCGIVADGFELLMPDRL